MASGVMILSLALICAYYVHANLFPGEQFAVPIGFGHDTVNGVLESDIFSPTGKYPSEPSKEVEGVFNSPKCSTQDRFGNVLGGGELRQCAIRGPEKCDPEYGFRSIDGTCNNLRRPTLGASGTTYSRLLPPWYSEHQQPPVSVTGHPLPNASAISRLLFFEKNVDSNRSTLLTLQWGQMISHDMSKLIALHSKNCCTTDRTSVLRDGDRTCFPILIDPRDPYFGPAGVRCINFWRTIRDSCSHHTPEQLTSATAFVDASVLYGSDRDTADSLRLYKGGLLRAELAQRGRWFPPATTARMVACPGAVAREACFLAGDDRINQHPQITVLQTILLREHNRLASTLALLNPHWDDERLFQEARRILIAEVQHISFIEWMLSFISPELVRQYNLLPTLDGYGHDYDATVDPSVLNEHATAAFRFYHSAIQGNIQLVTEERKTHAVVRLGEVMGRPDIFHHHSTFDDLVRGLTTQAEDSLDQFFTSEVTVYLFQLGRLVGTDLVSFDIQRARDHGLASYNDARHHCGMRRATRWEEFLDVICEENVARLSELYEHPDDVELYVGGFVERVVRGATTGPTFLCILAEQFRRSIKGDRFFYTNKENGLTPEQLDEIRKATAARLLCDNSDDVKRMQPKAFELISQYNPLVPCSSLPHINLEAWREGRGESPELPHELSYGVNVHGERLEHEEVHIGLHTVPIV